MDYYDYRELRTLILQSRILRYRIDAERLEDNPNRFRLSILGKLRARVQDRIARLLHRPSESNPAAAFASGA